MTSRIVAQRKLTKSDTELVKAYNVLIEQRIKPTDELIVRLKKTVGESFLDGEIPISGDLVEIALDGHGSVENRIIQVADLPPGTVSIRVYME